MSLPPILTEKRNGGLMPLDAYAAEQIDKLPDGAIYNARLSKVTASGREARDGLRGLWWGTMQLIADSTENLMYDEKRKASDYTLIKLGWMRPRGRADGGFDIVPTSIAESAMDDDEFEVLLKRAAPFWIGELDFDPFESWKAEQEAKKAMKGRYR